MEEIIIRLVEGLPEYQHIIYLPSKRDIVSSLKSKGYYSVDECGSYLCVSKNSSFIEKIEYVPHMMFEALPQPFRIAITINGGVFHQLASTCVCVFGGFLMRAFENYDEHSSTLPEIWSRLIRSLYGFPVEVLVFYTRTFRTEVKYTTGELQVNKLL